VKLGNANSAEVIRTFHAIGNALQQRTDPNQGTGAIALIVTKAFLEMYGRSDFTLRTVTSKPNYNFIYLSVSLRAFSCTFKETPKLGITLVYLVIS
jgi:ribosomal protein S5